MKFSTPHWFRLFIFGCFLAVAMCALIFSSHIRSVRAVCMTPAHLGSRIWTPSATVTVIYGESPAFSSAEQIAVTASESSELHSINSMGLQTLELDYKTSKKTDDYGNKFRYRAKVSDVHGAQMGRWAWDVFLVNAP